MAAEEKKKKKSRQTHRGSRQDGMPQHFTKGTCLVPFQYLYILNTNVKMNELIQ